MFLQDSTHPLLHKLLTWSEYLQDIQSLITHAPTQSQDSLYSVWVEEDGSTSLLTDSGLISLRHARKSAQCEQHPTEEVGFFGHTSATSDLLQTFHKEALRGKNGMNHGWNVVCLRSHMDIVRRFWRGAVRVWTGLMRAKKTKLNNNRLTVTWLNTWKSRVWKTTSLNTNREKSWRTFIRNSQLSLCIHVTSDDPDDHNLSNQIHFPAVIQPSCPNYCIDRRDREDKPLYDRKPFQQRPDTWWLRGNFSRFKIKQLN